jgi:hypothetical protein
MEPKFCKDCRYYQLPDESYKEGTCNTLEARSLDLVTGERKQKYATVMRQFLDCGTEAKLFQPKLKEI